MKLSYDRRRKRKFFLFLLIYLFFVTTYVSLNTFSKYASTANSGTTTQGVAKWDVSLDTSSSGNTINLINGNSSSSQDYLLTVTSQSEVGVNCDLNITNVPNGLKLTIDGTYEYTASNTEINVSNFCLFNANDANDTQNFVLTFTAPLELAAEQNRQIDINVTCIQRSS